MNNNIILIGYRATGKTSLAKYLSNRLNRKYYDTDELIENELQIPIVDIFHRYDVFKFRQIESRVLENLIDVKDSIISTGGGIIEEEKNRIMLANMGIVIWLRASVENILTRLYNNSNRPNLTNMSLKDEIIYKIKFRENLYKCISNYQIETDVLSIEQCGEKIIKIVE
jgi:shikimate kinase